MIDFPYMIPYANPIYFIYLLIALLPMIITLLTKGKRWSWYQVLVTLLFLYMSFGGKDWKQGVALIVYVIWQTILVWFYFHYRQKKNASGVFYLAVFLAILPLVLVKVMPLFLDMLHC